MRKKKKKNNNSKFQKDNSNANRMEMSKKY